MSNIAYSVMLSEEEKQAANFRQPRKKIEEALKSCQHIIDRQMKILVEYPVSSPEYKEAIDTRSRFIARKHVLLWMVGEQDDWV